MCKGNRLVAEFGRKHVMVSSHLRAPDVRRFRDDREIHASGFSGQRCDTAGAARANAIATYLHLFFGPHPPGTRGVSANECGLAHQAYTVRKFGIAFRIECALGLGICERNIRPAALFRSEPEWDLHLARRCRAAFVCEV